MDVKYLTYITAIAEEKNITKAAEKLFVSQSSLSYYLSKLEQEIGSPLFSVPEIRSFLLQLGSSIWNLPVK